MNNKNKLFPGNRRECAAKKRYNLQEEEEGEGGWKEKETFPHYLFIWVSHNIRRLEASWLDAQQES
jgi:hypothetical protein